MKINEIINFKIMEDCVATPNGVAHFLRIIPPNLSIMTKSEEKAQIESFVALLDAASIPFMIFIMDKIEDLSENKAFYYSLGDDYQPIVDAIVASMDAVENANSAVQRAYYIVTMTKELEDFNLFKALVMEHFSAYQVRAQEFEDLLRNFILREFVSSGIYAPENPDVKPEDASEKKTRFGSSATAVSLESELTKRLTPQRIQFTHKHIVQNDFLRKIILIKNFPSSVDMQCFMAGLAQIKNTTMSIRLEQMNEFQAAKLIDNQMRNVTAKSFDKRATKQVQAEVEAESIYTFSRRIARDNSKSYYINIYIEVYACDEKELRKKLESVKSKLMAFRITTEDLTLEQNEGFSGVYPFSKDLLKNSSNNMPSPTIAGMYPFSHSSRNDPEGMPLGSTADGGHMYLDFWLRDGNIVNGNFCIIGESGQGKSYLAKKITTCQIIRGTSCFAIDPDNEYSELFASMGGTNIDLADGKIKINPFEIRRMANHAVEGEGGYESELEAFRHKSVFFQHLSWLKDFFRVLFAEISYKELNALMILTQDMYASFGINDKMDISQLTPTQYPVFSDLYAFVSDTLNNNASGYPMITAELLKGLLLLLKDTHDGSLGHLLNGHTNIENNRLINFGIQQLLSGSTERTRAVLFNVMTYIWNRIANKLEFIMLYVDELHTIINDKNSIIAGYLRDFMKRARKYNAIIGTATQTLDDYLAPEMYNITAPLMNAPIFKFIFYPGELNMSRLQSMLGLSDGEIGCISSPKQGRCLVKAAKEKYLMHVGELPYEKSLFGSGGGR